jgi:hypothetical protein
LRSPVVTYRKPALSNASREPKLPLAGPTLFGFVAGPPAAYPLVTMISLRSESEEPPSQRARATAVVAEQLLT